MQKDAEANQAEGSEANANDDVVDADYQEVDDEDDKK